MQCYLHHVKVEWPAPTETAVEARARLADKFPRNALRRMTHLGMLVGAALDGVALTPTDAIVYASRFAETRALEDFLRSFPLASPLLFQTSIHPGAVQQVLIGRQQPVARLWPMTGGPRLIAQALHTVMLEPAERVVLLGGEERGTWLLEHGVASERAFAFAAVFTREAAGAVAVVRREAESPASGAVMEPSLEEFARGLAERRALAGADWSLAWI